MWYNGVAMVRLNVAKISERGVVRVDGDHMLHALHGRALVDVVHVAVEHHLHPPAAALAECADGAVAHGSKHSGHAGHVVLRVNHVRTCRTSLV